jgi:protein TonB
MLLPETLLPQTRRNSLPFVASLTLQCCLVLAAVIPWTVETLNTRLRVPSTLVFQPFKPPEAQTVRQLNVDASALVAPSRAIREFHRPVAESHDAGPVAIPSAPALGIERGVGIVMADQAHVFDALPRTVLQPPPATQPVPEPKQQIIPISSDIQAAKLIRRIDPAYPVLARIARVQGVVILQAIIATDGTIRELHIVSGPPLLNRDTVAAVQQWRYRPTILNGKPVEVSTTIEVHFTLSER